MEEKINIKLVNQLKTLFNFKNNDLLQFYNAFKELKIEKKKELLINFDKQIKKRKKEYNNLIIKLNLQKNKINEFRETKKDNLNLNFNI